MAGWSVLQMLQCMRIMYIGTIILVMYFSSRANNMRISKITGNPNKATIFAILRLYQNIYVYFLSNNCTSYPGPSRSPAARKSRVDPPVGSIFDDSIVVSYNWLISHSYGLKIRACRKAAAVHYWSTILLNCDFAFIFLRRFTKYQL